MKPTVPHIAGVLLGRVAGMPTPLQWTDFGAVLFDLDGVITPTADLHERAWATLFEPWGYTHGDYLVHIDGKPRFDGVASFLASRNIELPWGAVDDPPGEGSVCALGNRKNALFNTILDRDGIAAYPGSLAVLDVLTTAGVPHAIVSSSRNARRVLASAGLTERFPTVVDGVTALEHDLAGKPDPAMFTYAARLLEVDPAAAIVVEDAVSGVTAATAGGFGHVLGVDRGNNAEALAAAGATRVVGDLSETIETDATIETGERGPRR